MTMYKFETIYTKDNIKILTRAQVHAYYWKGLLMMLVSGIFLVSISLTCISDKRLAVCLIAVGCWLCMSPAYPAQYLAGNIHKKMGGSKRDFTYLFDQNGIRIESGSDKNHIAYHQIKKIIETKGEFCICLSKHSGILLSKADLKDQAAADEFKEFIRERTGVMIEREQTLFGRFMRMRLIKISMMERDR